MSGRSVWIPRQLVVNVKYFDAEGDYGYGKVCNKVYDKVFPTAGDDP